MRFLFLLITLLITGASSAKCIEEVFSVTGVMKDLEENPLAGVLVTVKWREFLMIQSSENAYSNELGEFSIRFLVSPFSGESQQGDQCVGQLDAIFLKFSKEGYVSDDLQILRPHSKNILTIRLKKSEG